MAATSAKKTAIYRSMFFPSSAIRALNGKDIYDAIDMVRNKSLQLFSAFAVALKRRGILPVRPRIDNVTTGAQEILQQEGFCLG